MAQHSHSHPPSLHSLLVVHTGWLGAGRKLLAPLEGYKGSAGEGSHSQGGFVGLVDLVDPVAEHTALDHTLAKGQTLLAVVEGSC